MLKPPPLSVVLGLCLVMLIASIFVQEGRALRAAELDPPAAFTLRGELTLAGSAPLTLTVAEDLTLPQLARALAVLTAQPLPAGSALPLQPDWAQAVWSTATQIEVSLFTTLEPGSGQELRVLTLPFTNQDTVPHTLPQVALQDELAFMGQEDVTGLEVVGLDAQGREYPAVALLCGETDLMPGAVRACQLVWEVPAAVALAAVELELPARLQYQVSAE